MRDVQIFNAFKCKMWHLHDRLGESIDSRSCASLMESMQKHGQKHPVLGRKIIEDNGYSVELIFGARRLFVAQNLRIDLLVEIRDVDDRSALIEMDIENRVRTDISPYERGMSYGRWLRAGFFNSQVEIVRAVGVSEAQVSRLLRYSELPTVVVGSFSSPREIREEWAGVLSKRCLDATSRKRVLRQAREVTASPKNFSPQQVFDLLIRSIGEKRSDARSKDKIIKTSDGAPLFGIGYRSRTIHFILPRTSVPDNILTKLVERIQLTLSG